MSEKKVFKVGDEVEVLLFRHPDHRAGTVEKVVKSPTGTYYKVRRKDGLLVDIDPYADGMRLLKEDAP